MYELLEENGIELVFSELEKNGYYSNKFKTMFVNQALSEEEQREVILHELGHFLKHDDYFSLYNNPLFHDKMEYEANCYMIDTLIDYSEGYFNYSSVAEKYHLGLGWNGRF